MTVSFHKYGDYFPGTGDISDIGAGAGKYCSLNFPLKDGMDDQSYLDIFKPIISKTMEVYRPGAVVLQCGADSLTGDRLGCFNLSIQGHGECVKFVKSFGLPMLVLGGGGYTIRNVARCWTYETSVLLDKPIKNELPYSDYFEYFGPTYTLSIPTSNMENANSYSYLEKNKNIILDNISKLKGAPSVQMQEIPPDAFIYDTSEEDDEDEDLNCDERISELKANKLIAHDNDFYDEFEGIDIEKFASN